MTFSSVHKLKPKKTDIATFHKNGAHFYFPCLDFLESTSLGKYIIIEEFEKKTASVSLVFGVDKRVELTQ